MCQVSYNDGMEGLDWEPAAFPDPSYHLDLSYSPITNSSSYAQSSILPPLSYTQYLSTLELGCRPYPLPYSSDFDSQTDGQRNWDDVSGIPGLPTADYVSPSSNGGRCESGQHRLTIPAAA